MSGWLAGRGGSNGIDVAAPVDRRSQDDRRTRRTAAIDRLLARSPLQPLFLGRAARRLTVLAYHAIEDDARFARHLELLRRHARPVSLPDVVAAHRRGGMLPERAVLVTFDDGDRSLVDIGVPLLRAWDIPAVAFVVAGALDSDRPFWWTEAEELARLGGKVPALRAREPAQIVRALKRAPDDERLDAIASLRATAPRQASASAHLRRDELRTLEAAGVAIGNHSLTHACLPQCRDEKIEREVRGAHRILADALGHPPTAFAYPNGDWDSRVVAVLAAHGYELGFLFDHRSNRLPARHPLLLSRVRVDSTASADRFRLLLSGLHPAIHRLRGRR
jgi:peptidoglycan/xylan/chitin deacetylase (PgdA/CDA1 family)